MKYIKHLIILFFTTLFSFTPGWAADACMTTFDKYFTAPSDSYLGAITALDDSFDSSSNYAVSYYFNIPMDGTVYFDELTFPSKTNFYYALNGCATTASSNLADGTTLNVSTGDELYIYTVTDKNKEFSFSLDYHSIDYYALDDSAETNGTEPVDIYILDNDYSASSSMDPATITIITNVTDGNITINPATGVVTYTPSGSFGVAGDSFTYTVDTANGDTTNIATVTITYPKPVAYDKYYSVSPDANINGNLITDAPLNYNFTDILEMNSNTTPSDGILSTVSSDGSFSYDANSTETTVTFTYTIKNKYLMVSDPATVTIFVNNFCGEAITLLDTDQDCTTSDTASVTDSVTEYAQYYKIILNEYGRLDINLSNEDLESAKTTLYYDFGNQCGTIFAKGTTSQIDSGYPTEFASMVLTAGTYYLGLYGVSKSNPVTYNVDVNFTSPCGGGVIYPTGSSAVGVNEPSVAYDTDSSIKTKIVYKDFGLRATHLDSGGNVSPYDDLGTGEQMVVTLQLADENCENPSFLGDGAFSDGDVFFELSGLQAESASKESRIKISALDYSQLLSDASGLNCGNSSLTSALCMVPACFNSVDNILSVFPPAFQPHVMTCIYGDGNGQAPCDSSAYYGSCNGSKGHVSPEKYNIPHGCAACLADAVNAPCSEDNFAIRPNNFNTTMLPDPFKAGQSYSITFEGEDFNGDPSDNYNENENSSFVVDVNISDSTKSCQESWIKFTPSINFTNGAVTDNYALNNVGDFNMTIGEIVGSEYALVDADDTPDADRYITPFFQQIKVVPHHFGLDGNLTNGSNDRTFTYLSNFEQNPNDVDRNVSASLDLNVSAETQANAVTSNYTSECYAKDGNLKLTLANAIDPNNPEPNSLTKLLWYHYAPVSNGSIALDGVTTEYNMPFLSTQFDSEDTNGTAEFNYKVNFDRNVTKVVNPFLVDVIDLNATDTDNVSGAKAGGNATFVYGRSHAARQRYQGDTGTANIYFESYCFGGGCDKTLLNGFSPNLQKTDDSRWYVNEAHLPDIDGGIGIVQQKDATPTNASDDLVDVTAQNNVAHYSTADLDYDESRGYPYKTTMHNNASPWLIYNEDDPTATRNEFQVEFDNIGTWTGENETDTTTTTPAGATTNRRLMW